MNDLATLNGKPRTLTFGGKSYDFYPLTLDDWGALQAWVDAQFPDPIDLATRAIERRARAAEEAARANPDNPAARPMPVAQQQHLLKCAMEQAVKGRRLIGTDEAQEVIMTMEGIKQLTVLSVRKGRPDFSDADAEALYKVLHYGDLLAIFAATNLDQIEPSGGGGESPKAEANGGPTAA